MNLSRLKPNDEMKLIEKKNFFFIGDNDVLETERKRFEIRDWKQPAHNVSFHLNSYYGDL